MIFCLFLERGKKLDLVPRTAIEKEDSRCFDLHVLVTILKLAIFLYVVIFLIRRDGKINNMWKKIRRHLDRTNSFGIK